MDNNGITYTAEEYAKTKTSKFRDVVEKYTIFSLIGNPQGLKILDAGCGDGIYARELINQGAKYVIGVDCAKDFIELAKKKNTGYENKIEYHCSFAQDFLGKNDCDLVVGSFLFSYPKNLKEAIKYCQAIASHLKPKGRFIGFNNNPFEAFNGKCYSKYGFKKIIPSDTEGTEITYLIDGMTDPIINFHLDPKTYEQAFKEAGFSEFNWHKVILNPEEKDKEHWEEFFKDEPPFIAMSASLL